MKFMFRGASSVALAAAFLSTPSLAQTAPQSDAGSEELIVITGSLIAGTPEDAALPVEVFSAEELEATGSPTALEFAKELTIAGPTSGESNYFGGGNLTGSPGFNLRGIGADKTLTLLNGRRMSENLSNIPAIAISRTEVLKDGAAVTYGADAVGGVVNFITRKRFTGLEGRASYKYIADTDGEYKLGVIGGIGEGDTNFMWSAEWEHRSRLSTKDRDFSLQPYSENPAPWSFLTDLARYVPRTAATTNDLTGGTSLGNLADFTQASCEAVGGVVDPAASGGQACLYNFASYYNLVEDQDIYRVFAQLDTAVTDDMDFHVDVSYGQVKVPKQFSSPSLPTTQGPAVTTGATFQYYVPTTNPYTAAFAQRTGWAANPLFSRTDHYSVILLRPFAHRGNPVNGGGDGFGNAATIDNQVWRVSASLNGNLGESFGPLSDVGYDFGVTYNQAISAYADPDVIGYRLQEALNGFGGPNCNATDLNRTLLGTQNPAAAGRNGCLWFNPFASAFPNQPELGLANPNYIPGQENPNELVAWLFNDLYSETTVNSITYDMVFNGRLPFELPGGTIGWALGAQGRQIESREIVPDDLYNGNTPCAWPVGQRPLPNNDPDFNGCTLDEPGPFTFRGTNTPEYYDQQGVSFFGEAQIPVLDRLNFQLAARHEEFSGGLADTVYKVSGKWDVFGPLSLRASYGTNFTAPPITLSPGDISNVVRAYTRVGNAWLAASQVTRSDVQPETATSWNVGAIWKSRGFAADHDINVIVDFFNIETVGEIGELVSPNELANGIFRFNAAGVAFATQSGAAISGVTAVNTGAALADCSHPLINRVRLNSTTTSPNGVCTQGSTRASDLNVITTDIGNGAGQTVAGFDFQADYTLPIGEADLTIGTSGTYLTEQTVSAKTIDGFEIAPEDDRLGFLNFNSITFATPELRLNFYANFNMDQHNFRLTGRYASSIVDERGGTTLTGLQPGTTTAVGAFTKGIEIDSSLTWDATYLFDINDSLRLSASISNILDEDPPFVRAELGYDPRLGVDALGRTIEIAIKKTF